MLKNIFCIIFIYFFIPIISLAQGYQPLVKDDPLTSAAQSQNLNDFLIVVFNWGIGVAVALTILFIIFGGIQYMTTDAIFKKEEGKKRITAAVVGLLICLSSWLILNQINPRILETDLGLKPISGSGGAGVPLPGNGGTPGGGQPPGTSTTPTTPGNTESPVYSSDEQAVRAALAAQGISINKNPCTFPTQTNCTDVNGFRQSTVRAISSVNSGLGGRGFVITGGTEHGHAGGTYSHSNGYKFDIGQGSNSGNWNNIDNYFKGLTGSSNISNNVTYPVTIPSTGQRLEIRRETSGGLHWDIKALP